MSERLQRIRRNGKDILRGLVTLSLVGFIAHEKYTPSSYSASSAPVSVDYCHPFSEMVQSIGIETLGCTTKDESANTSVLRATLMAKNNFGNNLYCQTLDSLTVLETGRGLVFSCELSGVSTDYSFRAYINRHP